MPPPPMLTPKQYLRFSLKTVKLKTEPLGYRSNLCSLTLSNTTDFRLFQTESVCRRQFDEIDRKFTKQVENTVGKGEIAPYKQFLLFPWCFQ